MISMRETKRILDLIAQLCGCGTRAEAEAIARELIEIGPEAGQLLSKSNYESLRSTLVIGLKAYVLGEVGPAQSLPFLLDCLEGTHPGVRRRAAEALCRLCERAAEDASLRRALKRRVRATAPVLQRLTGVKYVGSDIPTEPFRRALYNLDRLSSFESDRELPIPHVERVEPWVSLPIAASASDSD